MAGDARRELNRAKVDAAYNDTWAALWPALSEKIGVTFDTRDTAGEGPVFTEITTAQHGEAVYGALLAVSALQGVMEQVALKLGATPPEVAQAMASGRHQGREYYERAHLDDGDGG